MEEWYHQTDSNTTNQICHANINVSRSLLEPGGFSIFGDVSPLFLGQLLVDVMNFCKVQWELKLDMLRSYSVSRIPSTSKIPQSGYPSKPKNRKSSSEGFHPSRCKSPWEFAHVGREVGLRALPTALSDLKTWRELLKVEVIFKTWS